MPPAAAAAGAKAGEGILGAVQSNQVKQAQKGNQYRAREAISTGLARVSGATGRATGFRLRGLNEINKGYAAADAHVAGVGRAASQRILDRETQANGTVANAAVSNGFYGSSVHEAGNRVVSGNVNRALADLEETLAPLRTNVATQGGLAKAGQLGIIAQGIQSGSITEANLLEALAAFYSGQQPTAQSAEGSAEALQGIFALLNSGGGGTRTSTEGY